MASGPRRGQPTRATDEPAFAAAGPAVTLVITVVCGGLAVALPASTPGRATAASA